MQPSALEMMPNESNCDFRNRRKEARQENALWLGARRVTISSDMAIKSITHRGLRRFHEESSTRGIDARYADKLREMLTILEIASDVSEVNAMPGWRLHQLTGDLSGFWSLRVTGSQRLIFRFEDGDAHDLNLIDYH